MLVRPATPADAAAILAIYRPYVETTAIPFEQIPPSVSEMAKRIETYAASHGYFVAIDNDETLGFAYGSPYRPRDAYRFTAEVSVYTATSAKGRGIGRALYDVLIPHMDDRGFHTMIGIITLPNMASVRLHEAYGFEHVGIMPQVGFKFDCWHDVGIWQRPSQKKDLP